MLECNNIITLKLLKYSMHKALRITAFYTHLLEKTMIFLKRYTSLKRDVSYIPSMYQQKHIRKITEREQQTQRY